jgi:hypothetical protein
MFRDIIPFPSALKRGFISVAQECPAGAKDLGAGMRKQVFFIL